MRDRIGGGLLGRGLVLSGDRTRDTEQLGVVLELLIARAGSLDLDRRDHGKQVFDRVRVLRVGQVANSAPEKVRPPGRAGGGSSGPAWLPPVSTVPGGGAADGSVESLLEPAELPDVSRAAGDHERARKSAHRSPSPSIGPRHVVSMRRAARFDQTIARKMALPADAIPTAYSAPASCPSEATFLRQVRSRIHEVHSLANQYDIVLSAEGRRVRGVLRVHEGDRETVRELAGARATRWPKGLSLIMALLIDPGANTAPAKDLPPPETPPPAPPEPVAKPPPPVLHPWRPKRPSPLARPPTGAARLALLAGAELLHAKRSGSRAQSCGGAVRRSRVGRQRTSPHDSVRPSSWAALGLPWQTVVERISCGWRGFSMLAWRCTGSLSPGHAHLRSGWILAESSQPDRA